LIAKGHTSEEAARAARLALGGTEYVKETCRDVRGTRWLDDALQDGRYAWRALWQRPGFAAATLCTLALGIGATTVMFTVLDGVLLKPLPYPDPERLVAVSAHTDRYGDSGAFHAPTFSTPSARRARWRRSRRGLTWEARLVSPATRNTSTAG
jgi:hypothetical protein